MQLHQVIVTMGPDKEDGTNDDVYMEICSDRNNKECCKTDALKSIISDDWSYGDTEIWKLSYFKPCKGKTFTVRISKNILNKKGAINDPLGWLDKQSRQ